MKKKLLILTLVLLLAICGCKDKDEKEEDVFELAPNLVSDDKLVEYDEIEGTHDNKMVLEGGSGADPFVMRYNGMYYLYVTTGGGSIRGYKSNDMYSWEYVENGVCEKGFVYQYAIDDNPPSANTPYAPEVFYFNGYFYLLASPSGKGHYVLRSSNPEGPFENISGNIGKDIDGHYFVDGKDEKIYLYASGTSGIMCYELEDDMYTAKLNDFNEENSTIYLDAAVGNWNEGPYMLQRNGNYYLTYCGSHYLSASYRVDYAYADKNCDLSDYAAFTSQDTVLLSTTQSFRGLGHSSTVLGPDMDSYYIVYHNLEQNNSRNVNYSRLSFAGSNMVANDVKEEDIIKASKPLFSEHGTDNFVLEDDFLLSNKITDDVFTVEFNTTGEGKMIFSYIDSNNYSYIEFNDNVIKIATIENSKEKEVHKINLIREYSTSVNHSYRLQYKDGKMALFFDNIEKAYDINATFKKGKVGYFKDHKFSEIGYTAFSNVALGSSDNNVYNDHISLANSFDYELSYLTKGSKFLNVTNEEEEYLEREALYLLIANKGNRATYRTYLDDNKYSIELVVPYTSMGKRVGVRIDDGEIIEVMIPNNLPSYNPTGDVRVSLGVFDITDGQHNISIYNVGDEVKYSEVIYQKVYDNSLDANFNKDTDLSSFFTKGEMNLTDEGLLIDTTGSSGIIKEETYFNQTYSLDLAINSFSYSGYVGLVFNCNAYAKYHNSDADGANYGYPYSGYVLQIDKTTISLVDIRFNKHIVLETYKYTFEPGKVISLKVVQDNNKYTIYLDEVLLFNVNANVFNLSGSVGVFAKSANVLIKKIKV